jgi:hypothetical protein
MSKMVGVIVVIVGFLGMVYMAYGTLEPCEMLSIEIARDYVRRSPSEFGGFSGLVVAVGTPMVRHTILAGKSPGECLWTYVSGGYTPKGQK